MSHCSFAIISVYFSILFIILFKSHFFFFKQKIASIKNPWIRLFYFNLYRVRGPTPHFFVFSDLFTGKKLFSCSLCGKVLCSKASLKRHIADKHAERQEEYRCTICERVYCSRNSLMTHIYTYHKSRPGDDPIRFF